MLTFVMVSSQKKIVLSVSNDLYSDQRVNKVCISLLNAGYDIELLGRFIRDRSKSLNRPYPTKRFHLWFNTGPLFYFNLNFRLFFYLLGSKADLFIANDLDTLLANYLAAKFRRKFLVYDSHELFTEVPELINRPKVRGIWKWIESRILPNIQYAYTVSPSIAEVYRNEYGIKMNLVRNFPRKDNRELVVFPDKEKKEKVVIYQGALNIGRGLEELIGAFIYPELNGVKLWIFGEGDIQNELHLMVNELQLQEQVVFQGRKNPEDLRNWTSKAMLGVSMERSLGKNYEFALPNKVFDYIHAGVPVLYSPLKEMSELLNPLHVGLPLESHLSANIAKQIAQMIESKEYSGWVENCKLATQDLCWENEEKVLLNLIGDVFKS